VRIPSPIARRIGHRGASLVFFAALDALYGLSLFQPSPRVELSPNLSFANHIMPLWIWASVFFGVAAICVVGAFMKHDYWAFTFAVALKTLWGLTFALGFVIGQLQRGWVSAAIWLSMAGWAYIISSWPEPLWVPDLTGEGP
jgi:hypothetical protein